MIQRVDIPDRLIALQQAADSEHAKLAGLADAERETQWKHWYEAAVTVQAAVTDHAREAGLSRAELESAVKKAVRHPAPADG
ncbi:hypothetical protein EEJ42_28605 [Streptomyces botrytidirepellens]|uniref:Uncharacterized protein n=1 Tax=Streptomyces botrytidirepellens TaxID=2486417 RepID=A0A3M8VNC5_9ACTN|nr:hypothetical protein EEJ42_28605 [Streptomyces botrytidirepellens]